MKKVIFWHICSLNHWREIAEDQFKDIYSSNLFKEIDKIYITYLGNSKDDINFLLEKTDKISLIYYSNYMKDYERACLRQLKKWSQDNEAYVLYIHAKGVSRVSRPKTKKAIWEWRKMLEYMLINKYQVCINGLNDGYDVIGTNLCRSLSNLSMGPFTNKKLLFFSGNFWWAKTSYIKNLPDILEKEKDLSKKIGSYPLYWFTERWILNHFETAKIGEIYKSKYRTYYVKGPDYNYLTADLKIKEYKNEGAWSWPAIPIRGIPRAETETKKYYFNPKISGSYPNPPPNKY